MNLPHRIKAARRHAKLTQTALGDAVSVGQSTVAMWEKVGGNEPTVEKLREIALFCKVRIEWLTAESGPMTGKGQPLGATAAIDNAGENNARVALETNRDSGIKSPDDRQRAMVRPGDKNLPILGYGAGAAEGFFMDNGQVQGYTERPGMLEGSVNAYAVRVHDHSMGNVLRHGFLAWVDPGRPASPGDEVVIELKDGQAFIKTLVRRTQKVVRCHQYNPEGDVEFPTDQIKSIHLIVGSTRIRD